MRERNAPASSASVSETGSMVTPAAAIVAPPPDVDVGVDQLPDDRARFAVPRVAEVIARGDDVGAWLVVHECEHGRSVQDRHSSCSGQPTVGNQLIDERALLGDCRRQSPQFGHRVLLDARERAADR